MTHRENYLSIVRRTGYEYMPVYFRMCPSLNEKFNAYLKVHPMEIPSPYGFVDGLPGKIADREAFLKYYGDNPPKPGSVIDRWGVAREPGSAAAYHMKRLRHPMENFDSVEQIMAYPLPDYTGADDSLQREQVEQFHKANLVAIGSMACTIWETSWYMRGMENLMCDMLTQPEIAEALLDRVTEIACIQARSFAATGVDVIHVGDDIGTQRAIMMSEQMYGEWLKPRLRRVIDSAKAIKPDVIILYHSCGYVTELVPQLIEAGIDVLDPVQPECMDFAEIHDKFGDVLSFRGTIGTQTVMPFGTPDDVRREVFKNLDIAGKHGGLLVCPTHMLEPEVPPENVAAYIQACIDYTK
ncbi:MAG TPA: hypothetical protein GX011_02810 [Clostridiales bacterium]|jgi:uroporphyrinogen decarboxylase|nr:hypothetical protein [Clostridiales bacterium]